MQVGVDLNDQFVYEEVGVTGPIYFANPVQKTHDGEVTDIVNPEAHLVFYGISGEYFETQVLVDNQFGVQTLDVSGSFFLAVPSVKIGWWEQQPQ